MKLHDTFITTEKHIYIRTKRPYEHIIPKDTFGTIVKLVPECYIYIVSFQGVDGLFHMTESESRKVKYIYKFLCDDDFRF